LRSRKHAASNKIGTVGTFCGCAGLESNQSLPSTNSTKVKNDGVAIPFTHATSLYVAYLITHKNICHLLL
jgi:hypothetical protein